jgi:hypothetical protein
LEVFEALRKVHGQLAFKHVVSNADQVMNVLAKRNFPLALGGLIMRKQKFSLAGVQTRFEQAGAVISASTAGSLRCHPHCSISRKGRKNLMRANLSTWTNNRKRYFKILLKHLNPQLWGS